MLDLTGTNVVVSGGAGGIGSAAVRALGAAGARIAVIDLPDSAPEYLDQSTTHYSSCDITQRERVEAVFREIEDWFGEVHVLFNAAAYEAGPNRSVPAEDLSDRDLELQFSVNVFGTIHVTQAAFPSMRRAGGGRVVNFTSIAAVRGLPTSAHYAASKGAIGAWTRSPRTLCAADEVDSARPLGRCRRRYRPRTRLPGLQGSRLHHWSDTGHRWRNDDARLVRVTTDDTYASVLLWPGRVRTLTSTRWAR